MADAGATILLKHAGIRQKGLVEHFHQRCLPGLKRPAGSRLRSVLLPSTMTLLGIVRHMAQVERHWWRHRVAAEDIPNLFLDDDEWTQLDPVHAAEDYQQLVDEWAAVDTVAATYGLDHTFDRGSESWSVRTLYLHLIEEWARHNGHADLIREAIDGAAGE